MSRLRPMIAVVACLALTACSVPGPDAAPGAVHDPFEPINRNVHGFNKAVDTAVLRPVARSYVAVVPKAPRQGIDSVVDTLSLPGTAVNQLLQAKPGAALRSTVRFAVNLTFGFFGTRDAAATIGLEPVHSDFGETLHVWGFPEGAYVELPVLGPSNERDTVGTVVDLFLDPIGTALDGPQRRARTSASALERLNARGEFDDSVSDLLYGSVDSYSQTRLLSTQNRRFDLGDTSASAEEDPFELDTEGF